MNITIVLDDTDSVKRWINELRQSLRHVEPRVTFDSCLTWKFEDNIFDKKEAVLVLLSKNNWQFSEEVYKSRVKYEYSESKVKKRSRVCVVLETDSNQIDKKFRDPIGKDNICVVEDLVNSFEWLPMVCAFIFKRRNRKYSPTCSVTKVVEDSKLASLHQNLIKGLEIIDINVQQDLHGTPDCLILMRKRVTDSLDDDIKNKVNCIKENESLIFEYVVHFNDNLKLDLGNKMYGTNSRVIFIIHILYILRLIDVKAPHKKKPVRSGRINDVNSSHNKESVSNGKIMRRVKRIQPDKIASCCFWTVLLGPVYILISSLVLLLNPGFLLFFLTPLPYVAFIIGKLDKTSDLIVRKTFLIIWMSLCFLAINGGAGYIVFSILSLQEHWYMMIIFPYFVILSLASTYLQMKVICFNYAHNEDSNQPALLCSLIRAFVVNMKTLCIFNWSKCNNIMKRVKCIQLD